MNIKYLVIVLLSAFLSACGGGSTSDDISKPVITLLGTNPVEISVMSEYTDAGATATDNKDGDISSSIVVGGDSVDTSRSGVYVITYNVKDKAGNQADEVSRTVKVVDTNDDAEAPQIQLNGAALVKLNVGDQYTEAGATASDNQDGDLSSAIIIAGDTVDTSVAGTYIVTYNVKDSAGNPAKEVTRTVKVDMTATPVDTEKPVITLKGSVAINLAIGDQFNDPGATATDNTDGDISQQIAIAGDVVDTSKPGTYIITYNVKDSTGNQADQVTRQVVVKLDYTRVGPYERKRYPDMGLSADNYVVYYPKDHIDPSMPVVVFLEGGGSGPKIDDYRGVMEYFASYGYFVIGAESGQSYDSGYALGIVNKAINTAKAAHGLSVSKLVVMGHSQGGGQAFYVMKKLQEAGYGSDSSLTLSIDGWFAFNMNQVDLANLQGSVAFIQMNNLQGTGTDPRIHLTIWSHASNTQRKFLILPENTHGYVAGDLENVSTKRDMLLLLGALVDDSVNRTTLGYNTISQNYKTSYSTVLNALQDKDQYRDDCAGNAYNAKSQLDLFDIDYCNP